MTPSYRRERIELADGDFLDLDWHRDANDKPLVLILHGLEGCSTSHYAQGLVRTLAKTDVQSVVMHFRGCSGAPNRLPRSYHAGETGDLDAIVTLLKERFSKRPLMVTGFSLGGNVLLKYLGEQGSNVDIDRAVAVSAPFMLAESARRMNQGFSKVYQRQLVRSMHHSLEQKFKMLDTPINLNKLQSQRSFYQFDDYVTAPLHGFADVEDYYTRASSRPYLRSIATSTLIIHAADDPFLTIHAIPSSNELAATVQFELSEHGGHVGFVDGPWPWHRNYWLEQRISRYLIS